MRLKHALTLVLAMGLPGSAFAKDSSTRFLKKAAQSGLAEVSMSELALLKTGNPEVKEFAETMLRDHKSANARIEELARQKKVALPMKPLAADRAKADRLREMDPRDFDRAYLRENVAAHEKAVRIFADQAGNGSDADVRAFAAETLPKLEHHLEKARELRGKLGAKDDAGD